MSLSPPHRLQGAVACLLIIAAFILLAHSDQVRGRDMQTQPVELRYIQYDPKARTYTVMPSTAYDARLCAKLLEGPTACRTVDEFRSWVLGRVK